MAITKNEIRRIRTIDAETKMLGQRVRIEVRDGFMAFYEAQDGFIPGPPKWTLQTIAIPDLIALLTEVQEALEAKDES